MEISTLFKIQETQNNSRALDPSLDNYKLAARKHLELQIKLGELASITNCYKYWVGTQSKINKDILFSKYISCLKQILSLGADRHYDDIEKVTMQPSEYCLSDQFLNLYIDINDLIISPSKDHFITLTEDYLSLGLSLGYCSHAITDGFCNTLNIELLYN